LPYQFVLWLTCVVNYHFPPFRIDFKVWKIFVQNKVVFINTFACRNNDEF